MDTFIDREHQDLNLRSKFALTACCASRVAHHQFCHHFFPGPRVLSCVKWTDAVSVDSQPFTRHLSTTSLCGYCYNAPAEIRLWTGQWFSVNDVCVAVSVQHCMYTLHCTLGCQTPTDCRQALTSACEHLLLWREHSCVLYGTCNVGLIQGMVLSHV